MVVSLKKTRSSRRVRGSSLIKIGFKFLPGQQMKLNNEREWQIILESLQ